MVFATIIPQLCHNSLTPSLCRLLPQTVRATISFVSLKNTQETFLCHNRGTCLLICATVGWFNCNSLECLFHFYRFIKNQDAGSHLSCLFVEEVPHPPPTWDAPLIRNSAEERGISLRLFQRASPTPLHGTRTGGSPILGGGVVVVRLPPHPPDPMQPQRRSYRPQSV